MELWTWRATILSELSLQECMIIGKETFFSELDAETGKETEFESREARSSYNARDQRATYRLGFLKSFMWVFINTNTTHKINIKWFFVLCFFFLQVATKWFPPCKIASNENLNSAEQIFCAWDQLSIPNFKSVSTIRCIDRAFGIAPAFEN